MADDAGDNSKKIQSQVKPVKELMGPPPPPPPKKKYKRSLTIKKKPVGEGVSPDTSSKGKEEGDQNVVASGAQPGGPEDPNAAIRREIKKEIQKWARGYERIFQLLEQVEGPLEVKKEIVEYAIKKAIRFNCRDLVKNLEKTLKRFDSRRIR